MRIEDSQLSIKCFIITKRGAAAWIILYLKKGVIVFSRKTAWLCLWNLLFYKLIRCLRKRYKFANVHQTLNQNLVKKKTNLVYISAKIYVQHTINMKLQEYCIIGDIWNLAGTWAMLSNRARRLMRIEIKIYLFNFGKIRIYSGIEKCFF